MLDQMSGGRFELGVGRGVSPNEVAYYGVDPAKAQAMYSRRCRSSCARSRPRLIFAGEHYTFRDVPIELEPVQRPHPPLWYGLARPEGLPWVVANRVNVVCNAPPALVRQVTDGYRRAWAAAGHGAEQLPLMGMTRTVVVAESDGEAWRRPARAPALAPELHAALEQAWHQADQRFLSRHFRRGASRGVAVAGAPATVRDALARLIAETGVNYLVCRFAFGDLALADSLRSLERFASRRDAGAACRPGLVF